MIASLFVLDIEYSILLQRFCWKKLKLLINTNYFYSNISNVHNNKQNISH